MDRSQHVLRVHSFVLGEKVVGLDDKFGGGNVITETLAAAVVTSAMPQNIASFPNFIQVVGEMEEKELQLLTDFLTDGEVIYEGNI